MKRANLSEKSRLRARTPEPNAPVEIAGMKKGTGIFRARIAAELEER
jgi:hypothetical protein